MYVEVGTGKPTDHYERTDFLETIAKSPMSHPSPMKGKKLTEAEKARRRELRQQRVEAKNQWRAEKEAAERRRVASIERLIEDERIDPTVRAKLVLVLSKEYGSYPREIT